MSQELSVQFGNIIQTPTLFPQEEGNLQVTVTNSGTEIVNDTSLNLYASTDAELDDLILNNNSDRIEGTSINALRGTDELLGRITGLDLAPGETKTLTIDFASDAFQTPSVVSPGAYNLIAEIDPFNSIGETIETNNQDIQFISTVGTDPVLDWNSVFLNIVQAEGKADLANGVSLTDETIPGIAPPIEARDGAILHLAIYDAVNAISDSHEGYLSNLGAPSGASASAAVVGAAYGVLSELFPEYQELLDTQRDRSLAEITSTPTSEASGYQFGLSVAQQILELRANDGVNEAQVPYTPSTAPGSFQEAINIDPETGALSGSSSLLPDFGNVTPFVIDDVDNFHPDGPPAYGSAEFLAELEQIAQLGGLKDTAATDVIRTDEQTQIAEFWASNRIDTFRPPGQWYEIAQNVALQEGNSLEDNALLFAELATATADAGIVAWDTKYTYNQARPVETIRELIDPEWEPLLKTPPFPDYISGHATFAGAAATVLEDFFGDDVNFEVTSQELPGVTRVFSGSGDVSSFEQAALESADSRLYAGVHYASSNLDGVDTGSAVADYVLDNYFI